MTAYNASSLTAAWMREQAEMAYGQGKVSEEDLSRILRTYKTGFYTPNFFIRVGLAILSFLAVSFSMGFLSLLFASGENGIGIMFIFTSLLTVLVLEIMIRNNKHYRSGVDDALILTAGSSLVGGILILANPGNTAICLLTCCVALAFSIRYAYEPAAVLSALSFLAFVYFVFTPLGSWATATAPFLLLVISLTIAIVAEKLKSSYTFRYYRRCFALVHIAMLLAAYGSGNYFVVRQLGESLMGIPSDPGTPFAYGWLFWTFTFGLPAVYVIIGIMKHKAVFLRVGLLLIPLSVLTFRYYHQLLPAEIMMTVSGILLIIIGYLFLRWLQEPKGGFTAKAEPKSAYSLAQLEALVIAESTQHMPGPPPESPFGGGSSGGGGASGSY